MKNAAAFVAGMTTSGALIWLLSGDNAYPLAVGLGAWVAWIIWSDAQASMKRNSDRSDQIASNIYYRLTQIEQRIGLPIGPSRVE